MYTHNTLSSEQQRKTMTKTGRGKNAPCSTYTAIPNSKVWKEHEQAIQESIAMHTEPHSWLRKDYNVNEYDSTNKNVSKQTASKVCQDQTHGNSTPMSSFELKQNTTRPFAINTPIFVNTNNNKNNNNTVSNSMEEECNDNINVISSNTNEESSGHATEASVSDNHVIEDEDHRLAIESIEAFQSYTHKLPNLLNCFGKEEIKCEKEYLHNMSINRNLLMCSNDRVAYKVQAELFALIYAEVNTELVRYLTSWEHGKEGSEVLSDHAFSLPALEELYRCCIRLMLKKTISFLTTYNDLHTPYTSSAAPFNSSTNNGIDTNNIHEWCGNRDVNNNVINSNMIQQNVSLLQRVFVEQIIREAQRKLNVLEEYEQKQKNNNKMKGESNTMENVLPNALSEIFLTDPTLSTSSSAEQSSEHQTLHTNMALEFLDKMNVALVVALLNRVLTHLKHILPGAHFAYWLFQQHLLPHVYVNYNSVRARSPAMYSLSMSIQQLSLHPSLLLRSELCNTCTQTTWHAKREIIYLESILRQWIVRHWRRTLLERRRIAKRLSALEHLFSIKTRKIMLHRVFAAWRLMTREDAQRNCLRSIADEYQSFVCNSQITSKLGVFAMFSDNKDYTFGLKVEDNNANNDGNANNEESTENNDSQSVVCINKNASLLGFNASKMMAQKLAETAEHVKGTTFNYHKNSNSNNEKDKNALARRRHLVHSDKLSVEEDGSSLEEMASVTFHAMLSKLQQLEEITHYLREEVAIQTTRTRKLENTNKALQERNMALETDLLKTIEEKLHYCNLVQQKQFVINEKDKSIARLKSRIRAHAARPWQKVLLRTVGEMCGVSTHVSEAMDDVEVQHDLISEPTMHRISTSHSTLSHEVQPLHPHTLTNRPTHNTPPPPPPPPSSSATLAITEMSSQDADVVEQARVFGKLSPLILCPTASISTSAPTSLSSSWMRFALTDDALTILTDWANTCLDDLESLDDLKGGALSTRFSTLSEEARNGILLSRLLYYLALPRYTKRSAERDERQTENVTHLQESSSSSEQQQEQMEESDKENEQEEESSLEGTVESKLGSSTKNNSGAKKKQKGDKEMKSKEKNVDSNTNKNKSKTTRKNAKLASEGRSARAISHDYPRRRRQLLQRRNVQLDSPFPIYEECFGDLLNLIPSERMSLLLQFATELMTGCEFMNDTEDGLAAYAAHNTPNMPIDSEINNNYNKNDTNVNVRKSRRSIVEEHMAIAEELYRNVYSKFDQRGSIHGGANMDRSTINSNSSGSNPLRNTISRVELAEVMDPHALAMGERASLVTFIALLYVRFAHAFNHKSRKAAETEKAAILYLLSDGRYSSNTSGPNKNNTRSRSEAESEQLVEKLILSKIDDEDKTPWQLFKEKCLPHWGTSAHPFLLRGNFWPASAFESPALAQLLSELAMYLHYSLQAHRWHIIVSCLIPVMTYSGLSRGVFTGPRASPSALRVGLERDRHWNFPIHCTRLHKILVNRANYIAQEVHHETGPLSEKNLLDQFNHLISSAESITRSTKNDYSNNNLYLHVNNKQHASLIDHLVAHEKALLMSALRVVANDLLVLFLRFSTLSAELALPTLDLGGWRLLCADLHLLSLTTEAEVHTLLDMESVTEIYYEAVLALNEAESAELQHSTTTTVHLKCHTDKTEPSRNEYHNVHGEAAIQHIQPSEHHANDSLMHESRSSSASMTEFSSALSLQSQSHHHISSPLPVIATTNTTNSSFLPSVPRRNLGASWNISNNNNASNKINTKPLSKSKQNAHRLSNSFTPQNTSLLSGSGVSFLAQIPKVYDEMTFTAFLMGCVLVANTLYPAQILKSTAATDKTQEQAHIDSNDNVASYNNDRSTTTNSGNTNISKMVWLADALKKFVFCRVVNSPLGNVEVVGAGESDEVWDKDHIKRDGHHPYNTSNDVCASPHMQLSHSQIVIRRLTMGAETQEVLVLYTPAIILVFNAYSKDIYGVAGMEKEDLLKLLREAMLTSTEISQYLIFELFKECCVARRSVEESASARRREMDGKPRDVTSYTNSNTTINSNALPNRSTTISPSQNVGLNDSQRRGQSPAVTVSTSINTNNNNNNKRTNDGNALNLPTMQLGRFRSVEVLVYEGFVHFLCLLCAIKQPNPLIPFDVRLQNFLRRMFLRPLIHKVENLAPLLNRTRLKREAQLARAAHSPQYNH